MNSLISGSPVMETRNASAGAIVRDISLVLESGLVGLVGPNGSGKTTLLRALAGVAPHGGQILFNSEPVNVLHPLQRARLIAYLPQIVSVSWPVSSTDLVMLGRLPHGDGERATGREAVRQAMTATGIMHLANRQVDTLSGGERARVLLARALAVEAPVLIADEPIAALDPRYQIETMQLLRDISDSGKLVVAAIHDLALAARYCDRLLVMNSGTIAADGTPDDALNDECIETVFGLRQAGSDRFGPVWEHMDSA